MVSIIVPVYNVEKYLKRCIDSLLAQDYNSYEIILINDGSKDSSPKICEKYAKCHSNIHYYSKENGGLSSARNYGVKMAKGNYITFVDSDDYVSTTYVSDLVYLLKKHKAEMAVTRVVLKTEKEIKEQEKSEFIPQFKDFALSGRNAFLEIYINNRVGWSACGKIYPRELLLKIPFPAGYYEEMATAYLFVNECTRVAFGDYERNYSYIRREGSITDCPLTIKHLRIFEVCKEIKEYTDTNYKGKEYVSVLLYQNAVLQLITKLSMTDDQFEYIFTKYRNMFRRNLFTMLKTKDIVIKSKYYSVLLCTSPSLFKFQRRIRELLSKVKT